MSTTTTTQKPRTALDILSGMDAQAIAARASEICRLKGICEKVVEQSNGGIRNPAAAGQVLNILLGDIAASQPREVSN